MSFTHELSFGQNGAAGAYPAQFWGVDVPDGDRAEWMEAPVGSIYAYKPDETTNVRLFEKRDTEDRDDDWGALGGMHVIQQRVEVGDFTDGGSTSGTLVLDEQIPVGAFVLRAVLVNVTGFTGDTSATMTIGDGSDADRYNASTPSVFTTATAIDMGAPSGTQVHTAAKSVTLTVTSNSDFGAVTAGAATVRIYYLL